MATTIVEFHGAAPGAQISRDNAALRWCPFIDAKCIKVRGACSLQPVGGEPVIICPNRLYADHYETLSEIAMGCFGASADLITPEKAAERRANGALTGYEVLVYGKGWGGEVGITAPAAEDSSGGTFKIDFILSHVGPDLEPLSLVAVEVQTIDTTNNYRNAADHYYSLTQGQNPDQSKESTNAGYNWENVNKRILPQLIYKGHALRREQLAQHGLFFVLPDQVYDKILARVGGDLLEYPKGPGTITFHTYTLGPTKPDGTHPLVRARTMTTSVEQLAFAFVSPRNLPEIGVYERALKSRAEELRRLF